MERRKFLILAGEATAGIALACALPATPTIMPTEAPRPPAQDVLKTPASAIKETLSAKPFITLPFSRHDLPVKNGVPYFEISQGWNANEDDKRIAKITSHDAIDYKVPYGTIFSAPYDCWVTSSLQEGWRTITDKGKEIEVLHNGKKVAYGGGIFVELIPNDDDIRSQGLHLCELLPVKDEKENEILIPFAKPVKSKEGGWSPTENGKPLTELRVKNLAVFVKQGTPLARIGYTGLGLDVFMKYNGENRPPVVEEGEFETWDTAGAHLHFEVMRRAKTAPYSKTRLDPYGIKGNADQYPTPGNPKPMGKDALFITYGGNEPVWAAGNTRF